MKDKIKEIEAENRKNNTKLFHMKVGENNKAYKGKVKGIKNKEGRITELEQEYKQIWMMKNGYTTIIQSVENRWVSSAMHQHRPQNQISMVRSFFSVFGEINRV